MKKSILNGAIAVALGSAGMSANAALTTSAVLQFDPGVISCISNVGTPPGNCYYGTAVKSGSYFAMDTDGNGFKQSERTAISMHDGIHIGVAQGATGSHSGAPFGAANGYTGDAPIQVGQASDGSPIFQTDGNGNQVLQTVTEVPGIDEPWNFFGNTGMHFTTSPITEVAPGELDFSGWRVTWNGIPAINMGTGANATITCSTASCSDSSTFTLDYAATVPAGDASGFGGVAYAFHATGHVQGAPTIPVPAAAWLFGSGLIGLVGVARRRKARA